MLEVGRGGGSARAKRKKDVVFALLRLANKKRARASLRRWATALAQVPGVLVAIGLGTVAALALAESDFADYHLSSDRGGAGQDFFLCRGAVRLNCVVDGDTFWLEGQKIRIADINAPEISHPACAAEAALARQARQRLAQLLSAGPFDLARTGRDEDRYGRKLRLVQRDAHSIGAVLVAEGLAHEWRGQRESWC